MSRRFGCVIFCLSVSIITISNSFRTKACFLYFHICTCSVIVSYMRVRLLTTSISKRQELIQCIRPVWNCLLGICKSFPLKAMRSINIITNDIAFTIVCHLSFKGWIPRREKSFALRINEVTDESPRFLNIAKSCARKTVLHRTKRAKI